MRAFLVMAGVLLCVALLCCLNLSLAQEQEALLARGMQLYSFLSDGGVIKYALFSGTNRDRYEVYIVEQAIDLDALIEKIKACQKGETIFWFNNIGKWENVKRLTFVYPDKKTIEKIKQVCRVNKIGLVLP